ncbi:MAG TPA: hypothetical protein VGQ29_15605 [Gemmatimonadales bacterium]|nr:hypothetical protein [Gemmatimonadales bacterium]
MTTVHLGYEVGTGEAVAIPLRHMVVSGQTQESGKTTTLEALVARSDLRAVTFVTKRGEGAFAGGRRLQPFFRERADWVFVSSLIDATLGEKNKLLRAWLMKVCHNTKTLAEVQRNVAAAKATARGFSESIYTEIEGYLELVVPQLAQLPPHTKVVIGPGLNVMDLAPYSTELQALVIRSVLEHVYEHEEGVVTVIPEAWEFLPEGRGSPVKREAEALIRKGAGLKNYVWLDSQDLAGVWKLAVRAAPVVLIGVQREANEIKRTLANIPAGIAKPTAAAVAKLELGQFFACWGQHTRKVYVQPAWMNDRQAIAVAPGEVAVAVIERPRPPVGFMKIESSYGLQQYQAPATNDILTLEPDEDIVNEAEAIALREENQQLRADNADLRRRLEVAILADPLGADRFVKPNRGAPPHALLEERYLQFKQRLAAEAPGILKLLTIKPELEVTVERKTITVDSSTLPGRVARLIAQGFFREAKSQGAAAKELRRTGNEIRTGGNLSKVFDRLVVDGFLTSESDGYREVSAMKVNVVQR